jgi:hypothetical protein
MVLANQNHYQVVGIVFAKFLHHRNAVCLTGSREHVLQHHSVLTQMRIYLLGIRRRGEALARQRTQSILPSRLEYLGCI